MLNTCNQDGFLCGCKGKRIPIHFVNLTRENQNFKIVEFMLKQTSQVLRIFMLFVKFYQYNSYNKDVCINTGQKSLK